MDRTLCTGTVNVRRLCVCVFLKVNSELEPGRQKKPLSSSDLHFVPIVHGSFATRRYCVFELYAQSPSRLG